MQKTKTGDKTITQEITIPSPELVETSKLKVHPEHKNPNIATRQVLDRLKESIKRFGFLVPIITNKDYVIADGEQRWIVACELAMPKVLVVRVPLEEVDRILIQQIMNKLRGEHDLLLDAQAFENIINLGKEDDLKYFLDLDDIKLKCYLENASSSNPDWIGMPEYNSANNPDRVIIVHFRTEEAVKDFAKLVKQNISPQTKYIHFPYEYDEHNTNLRYVTAT